MLRQIKHLTSVRIRLASDRAISRIEIITRAAVPCGDYGLSRHDLVPSQSEQRINITVRILERCNSKAKVGVGVKMAHGVSPVVRSDHGPFAFVSRRRDKVHG